MTVFAEYAKVYDLLYRDKDYAAEAGFIAGLIGRYALEASSILDLGCGTGLHAHKLASLGYKVHGVDLSFSMLKIAETRRAGLSADEQSRLGFGQGDIRTFSCGRTFDATVSLFHVLSYQIRDDDVRAAFATARDHLRPHGIFLFDFWNADAILAEPPTPRVKQVEDEQITVVRRSVPTWLPEENLVEVNYLLTVQAKGSANYQEISERHVVRYFSEPEMRNLAEQSGFKVLTTGAWMSESLASPGDWSIYAIARAE
jgi:SAM-dependent methyltransferase